MHSNVFVPFSPWTFHTFCYYSLDKCHLNGEYCFLYWKSNSEPCPCQAGTGPLNCISSLNGKYSVKWLRHTWCSFVPPPMFCIYLRIAYQKDDQVRAQTFHTQCQVILPKSCCQINNDVFLTVFVPTLLLGWWLWLLLFFRGGCLICVFNDYFIGVWKIKCVLCLSGTMIFMVCLYALSELLPAFSVA